MLDQHWYMSCILRKPVSRNLQTLGGDTYTDQLCTHSVFLEPLDSSMKSLGFLEASCRMQRMFRLLRCTGWFDPSLPILYRIGSLVTQIKSMEWHARLTHTCSCWQLVCSLNLLVLKLTFVLLNIYSTCTVKFCC